MTHTPVEMLHNACKAGAVRQKWGLDNLFLRAFMGGLMIASGAALATVCGTGIQTLGIKQLIVGAVFPIGLIAIVLTGMDLFTGDCMLVPLSMLSYKSPSKSISRVWAVSYLGNLTGALFWAFVMYLGPMQTGDAGGLNVNAFGLSAIQIAAAKTLTYKAAGAAGWASCFVKGIACNMLVNIAILLGITSKNVIGKIIGIWFPIMAFVATGFEHSSANMYFIPVAMMLLYAHPEAANTVGGLVQTNGGISVSDFLAWNLAPATLGNIIGGMIFIAFIYYYIYKDDLAKEVLVHDVEKKEEKPIEKAVAESKAR